MSQYKLMRGIILSALGLALSAGFFIPFQFIHAQAPCGEIIIPPNYYQGTEEVRTPIADCNDPFEVTNDVANPYTVYINNNAITADATIVVPSTGADAYRVEGDPYLMGFDVTYYKHDGPNYEQVRTNFDQVPEDRLVAYAETYFTDPTVRALYQEIALSPLPEDYFYDENGNDVLDSEGQVVAERYDDFYYSAAANIQIPLQLGIYTAVVTEYELFQTYRSFFDQLREFVIPTAYANHDTGPYPRYVFAITFTIANEPPPPTGASSVLFLPGIMGSELYEKSPELVCDLGGGEFLRWFSMNDCSQLRLITDSAGDSVNDIYTKAGDEAVIERAIVPLYESFFDQLATWKKEEKIKDYALFAYDWRLRLDELITAKADPNTGEIRLNPGGSIQDGYLYKTLERLSEDSFNDGKVTIVAHSNGGLLIKAFLAKLQQNNDPLLDKVDNLILVATPQLGTPDALMGMLHGAEIGPSGFVVSKETSRVLLNTMPFAYHLLPSDSYFDSTGVTVDTPVITFEQGTSTTPWANTFGATVTDAATMERFLTIDSGRIRPERDDLEKPEVLPKYLFDNYTKQLDTLLNTWRPPVTMQVKEIAGVGVETLSGLTYFTDKECVSRNPLLLFKCTAYAPKLGMRPETTIDGDATVVAPSALAMSETYPNVERWWVNLFEQNDLEFTNHVHRDIFEVEDITNFVFNTLLATTSQPYTYLTNTPAVLPDEKRLTFILHSPLDLAVSDSRGSVSSSSESINGGIYRRYGEIQYISIPDNGNPATVKLAGEATGSFTLEVATYNGETLDERHSYSAIPSSTSTKVTLVVDSDLPIDTAPLMVDYDGNGTPEIVYDTAGEIVPVITYTTLLDTINALTVKSLYKKLLLENAKVAQQYDLKSLTNVKYRKLELLALEVLRQQVLLYERSRIITSTQKQELIKIIDELKK